MTTTSQRPRAASRRRRRGVGPMERGVAFFLSIAAVGVAGLLGVRAITRPEPARWPDRVAVIGLDPANRAQPVTYLGVLDPARQTVVDVPVEAVVEIPRAGFLRAYHAHRLGGSPLVRSTLALLFGVDVPFSITGPGDTTDVVARTFTQAHIPRDHLDDLRAAAVAAPGWQHLAVHGRTEPGARGRDVLVLDPASVRDTAAALGGGGARTFVDPRRDGATLARDEPTPTPAPTAAPTIPPPEIKVDVLNGGDVELAATKTAHTLREAGFTVERVADAKPQNNERSVVYATAGRRDRAEQVGAALGYPVEELDPRFSTTAEVLVVLGHDARV